MPLHGFDWLIGGNMEISKVEKAIAEDYGYLVHFEHCGNGLLRGDFFPEVRLGEEPFQTKEEAEMVGVKYAKATKGKTCNFYLVRSDSFASVGGWKLQNR